MNKKSINEILEFFENENYKNLFGALISFEKFESKVTDNDVETLERIFNKFMESKTISGILNDELVEIIESECEE